MRPQEKVWWAYPEEELAISIKKDWRKNPGRFFDEEGKEIWDTSILSELLGYDHWDITSSCAFEIIISSPYTDIVAPSPSLIGLFRLSKMRLAQGLHKKDMLPALQEVRYLSRLTFNHELIVDSFIGLGLLKIEAEAFEKAVEQGLISEQDWTPISEQDIELAKAVLWASVDSFDYSSNDHATALLAQNEIIDRCSILSEAGFRMVLIKSLIASTRWSFEYDIALSFERFEKLWKSSGCTLPLVQKHWSKGRVNPADESLLLKIPYLRMNLIYILSSKLPPSRYETSLFLEE